MREQLNALRREMKAKGIDAYLIPTTDFHGSEYVNEYFTCRKFMSGFTGSAGTLLVTDTWAGLWTDGRYFLQAEAQLAGSGIDLMKEREPGVPAIEDYLSGHLPAGSCLGFDGRVVSCRQAEPFAQRYRLKWNADLVGEIWKDRPPLCAKPIYEIPLSVTGETAESKLHRLRAAMKEAGAQMHLITRMEEIAWLYNLRGSDVENTPVFFSFFLALPEGERLYVLDPDFPHSAAASHLPASTEVQPYFQIFEDLKSLPAGKLLLCRDEVSYAMVCDLPGQVEVVDGRDPAEWMKAFKNETEIRCTKAAHLRDGAAMVRFLCWLKQAAAESVRAGGTGRIGELTEIDAADYLKKCRMAQKGYKDLSFATIAGYGANGAIIHYDPTPETNAPLQPEGFLLVDSGGQYEDGTTDITRTIALGPLTREMKENYTCVLKSHIALATARFPEGTTGAQLDQMTRRPLLEKGLNYNHGTGHGVGHLLSVHEGPNTISPRGEESRILAGMITSDEPGVYQAGQYGIRLENEILCRKGKDGMLEFEPLTWCPWEPEAILPEMLTDTETQWLNEYHRQVREKLVPLLDEETASWLEKETAEI
ncbi:MAG: aminopeptidase P family protein [Firmicutes bacterium]|nr:aminopeptidase P family protein [Bacillota bacterium]MDY5857475.1 aminopeptidase P family protein [Anaerovoracaceae bacterium]